MANKLIDMGEEMTREIKNLDAQILNKIQIIQQERNLLEGLKTLKQLRLHQYAKNNGLEGDFELTDDYFLREVEKKVEEVIEVAEIE